MRASPPSRPSSEASPHALAALGAAAVAAFLAGWVALHHGFYTHGLITDVPVYEKYGRWMADGLVPYRDFTPEYPPLALPVFLLPALGGDYTRGFEALMAACGALGVALVALVLREARASLGRAALGLGLAALFPLVLGPVVLSRFDLWPALLVTASLVALAGGRDRLGALGLGLAVAAKIYPGVLLPLALAWTWRRHGRREALVCGAVAAGTVLLAFAPFLVVAPDGVASSLGRQISRPLQIESLGAALLLAARHLGGSAVAMEASHGSQNVAGRAGDAVGWLSSLVQLAVLAWVWLRFARGPMTVERLLRHAAAAVVAFVALGKVLSPQFLVWLAPLAALVAGRRGLAAGTLLAGALVTTQLWFPSRYWDFALTFDPGLAWLVLLRDLLLVAVLAVLVAPDARGRAAPG